MLSRGGYTGRISHGPSQSSFDRQAYNFEELEAEALTGVTGTATAWEAEPGVDRCVAAAVECIRMGLLSRSA